MKKWPIVLILSLALALLVGTVVLLLALGGRGSQTETDPAQDVAQYVQTALPDFSATYSSGVLTLGQPTNLSYDTACAVGANVYCDELAPETYLPQVQSIRADVMSACGLSSLRVVLAYMSTDGEIIWSIDSSGTVTTCWSQG